MRWYDADPASLVRGAILAMVGLCAMGLVSWGLMQVPFVNDTVLGDLPREMEDFARLCEDGSQSSGEPFPRAASYEPGTGGGPHPWVAIEDGWDMHSAKGTETKAPEWGDEPDPAAVQLVACGVEIGAEPGTEISCQYTDNPLGVGAANQTVEFAQGRYQVTVFEARTGDLVGEGTLKGDEEVECWERVVGEDTGAIYTSPTWDAYADLFADLTARRGS